MMDANGRTPVSVDYKQLTEYCRTDRQRQVMELVSCGLSRRQVAKELGCTKSVIDGVVDRVRAYGQVKGVDPQHGCDHPVSDAYLVKGTSTLYDAEGQMRAQWVKTSLDQDRVRILQKNLAEEFAKTLPRYKPDAGVSLRGSKCQNMLAVLNISDGHIGMRSWAPETGKDYDTEIAEKLICETVTSLIDQSPLCEECLLEFCGDLLHVDNAVGVTERSGNILDVDGRYSKILSVGIKVMRYAIEYALRKYPHVTTIICQGNHDDLGSLWLSAAMTNIYENESRLKIIGTPAPRQYFRWNDVLIMATHGADAKPKDLPLIMASERREDWGATKHHVIHMGHVHRDTVSEIGDCVVESFDAMCSKDAWSNAKGYQSRQSMKMLFYHPTRGEVMRFCRIVE